MNCTAIAATLVVAGAWTRLAAAQETTDDPGATGRSPPAACLRLADTNDVVRCALAASPEVREARAHFDAAAARRATARVLLPSNPTLVGTVSNRRRPPPEQASVLNWSVAVSQEVELGGQRGARIEQANAAADAQARRVKVAEQEVAAGALTAYYEALASQDTLRFATAARRDGAGARHVRRGAGQGSAGRRDRGGRRTCRGSTHRPRPARGRAASGRRARGACAAPGRGSAASGVTGRATRGAAASTAHRIARGPGAEFARRGVRRRDGASRARAASGPRPARAPPQPDDLRVCRARRDQRPHPRHRPLHSCSATGAGRTHARRRDRRGRGAAPRRGELRRSWCAAGCGWRWPARSRRSSQGTPRWRCSAADLLMARAHADLAALREAIASRQLTLREGLQWQRSLIELLQADIDVRLARALAWVDLRRVVGLPFSSATGGGQ